MLGGASRFGILPGLRFWLWSDQDFAICREGAEASADFVDGRYRFEGFEGVNHWGPEIAGERVADLLLDHVRSLQ